MKLLSVLLWLLRGFSMVAWPSQPTSKSLSNRLLKLRDAIQLPPRRTTCRGRNNLDLLVRVLHAHGQLSALQAWT